MEYGARPDQKVSVQATAAARLLFVFLIVKSVFQCYLRQFSGLFDLDMIWRPLHLTINAHGEKHRSGVNRV